MRFDVAFDVPVPMNDGTELATSIWRPQTQEPVPVLLMRTPYDKRNITPRCTAWPRTTCRRPSSSPGSAARTGACRSTRTRRSSSTARTSSPSTTFRYLPPGPSSARQGMSDDDLVRVEPYFGQHRSGIRRDRVRQGAIAGNHGFDPSCGAGPELIGAVLAWLVTHDTEPLTGERIKGPVTRSGMRHRAVMDDAPRRAHRPP